MQQSANKFDLNINDIKTFDIKEYIFKVLSHWKLFLTMLILGLIVAFYVNMHKERIYELDSIITVKEEQNPLFTSSTNIAFNWGGPSDKVETIKTILTSRTHNEKVVKELQYYLEYLKDGRFRMEDVYGKTPFTVILDTNAYQIINVPIKLSFKNNDNVTV
ncbi:MAG: sugar transporter, partial [Flavobacteriales bacterium]